MCYLYKLLLLHTKEYGYEKHTLIANCNDFTVIHLKNSTIFLENA